MASDHPPAPFGTETRPAGWWRTAVVYQVYPRSFADSDGDGVGDLPGITAHLDHLERLGIDVLWLSPVYRSPMDDNGYDISDYQDVDPLFGTLADLDALIAGCHARGIRLVMDLVVNHTSDEHPWFVESARPGLAQARLVLVAPGPARPRSPAPRAPSRRTGSRCSPGPAWELDEASGEYYLHLFSRKQPDLNWENPQVRQAVYAMMRWWVDRGVDGFRMDVIDLISRDPTLPDGPVPPGGRFGSAHAGGRRTARGCEEFLAEMNREVGLDAGHLLTVGEMPGVDDRAGPAGDRPGAPRARHGLHLRARRPRRAARRPEVGHRAAAPARAQAQPRGVAGGARRRRAGTRSTGTTTTSPAR